MLKQRFVIGLLLTVTVFLGGCVSEQTYVGSDKPVSERTFDNLEAARTRISLGLNYLRLGDTSQAKYNLERARTFAPNSAEVYSALAFYYQTVGEQKQAEDNFKLSIQKDVNYADAYNNYGAFLCQLERYDEAEQLLQKAITRPGYIRVAESYENLALCQLAQNNFVKAKTYLESSITHNTTRISSLTLLAGIMYATGDNNAAKAQIDRIQRLGRLTSRTVLLSYLIAKRNADNSVMANAEQLLITLYPESRETQLLLNGRLNDSEFEIMRERYKDSLLANIVSPVTKPSSYTPPTPVENPKLKIVKRKASESENNTAQTSALPSASPDTTSSAPIHAQPPQTSQPSDKQTQQAQKVEQDALVVVLPDNAPLPKEIQHVSNELQNVSDAKVLEEKINEATSIEELTALENAVEARAQAELEVTAQVSDAFQKEVIDNNLNAASEVVADVNNEAKPERKFHVVKQGESPFTISVAHNVKLASLMKWNKLKPKSVIKAGQKIYIEPELKVEAAKVDAVKSEPAKALVSNKSISSPYHEVLAGETMFSISYLYNIRLEKFLSWNNLTEQSKLRVGQRVYIVEPATIENE